MRHGVCRRVSAQWLIDLDLGQSAIHEYLASCHVAAVVGSKECRCAGRFSRIAQPPKRCARPHFLERGLTDHFQRKVGLSRPWRQNVHADASAAQVLCPAAREVLSV